MQVKSFGWVNTRVLTRFLSRLPVGITKRNPPPFARTARCPCRWACCSSQFKCCRHTLRCSRGRAETKYELCEKYFSGHSENNRGQPPIIFYNEFINRYQDEITMSKATSSETKASQASTQPPKKNQRVNQTQRTSTARSRDQRSQSSRATGDDADRPRQFQERRTHHRRESAGGHRQATVQRLCQATGADRQVGQTVVRVGEGEGVVSNASGCSDR